jgi:60 kDa SS-A/Ro ribonucleoprotein
MRTNQRPPALPPLRTFEGTRAQRLDVAAQFERTLASCLLWESQFYENGEDIAERLKRLTLEVHPEVAYEGAIRARTVYKLRHAPLWVARWLATGDAMQRAACQKLIPQIILRPDELAELLSLYWKDGKTPIAACIKKGLAEAFTKFDAFSLAKYNRDNAIKLRDVLFMVHAKPKDAAQAETWKQLVEGTLPIPDTWETRLSAGEDKRAVWTDLLERNILGPMALLMNLRNMKAVGVPRSAIQLGLAAMNVERVLPFRFITAARYAPELEPDLEAAMYRCVAGMPKLEGRTALVIDTSPSMWQAKISERSEMDRFEAAAALAILVRELCSDVRVYWFNQSAGEVPSRRGFALRDALAATKGNASRGDLAVQQANRDGYERIVVLTDGEWHAPYDGAPGYHQTFQGPMAPAAQVISAPLTEQAYLINVASQVNTVGTSRWTNLEGWSEGVVAFIQALEGLQG